MDHTLTKLSKDIETIAAKSRYYRRYSNYRKSEDDTKINQTDFLNQVINQDIAMLKKLELELSLWHQTSKANMPEEIHFRSNHLNFLIQEALSIYKNLLLESQSPCEIN